MTFFRISVLLLVLGLTTMPARAGTERGSGGDSIAIEFKSVGVALSSLFKRGDYPILKGNSIDAFEAIVREASVQSTDDELSLGGEPKSAINFADEKKIVVNRKRWEAISSYYDRAELVFHEYLGLLGWDDPDYHLSSQIPWGSPQRDLEARLLFLIAPVSDLNDTTYLDQGWCFEWGRAAGRLEDAQKYYSENWGWIAADPKLSTERKDTIDTLPKIRFPKIIEDICVGRVDRSPEAVRQGLTELNQMSQSLEKILAALTNE